MSRSSQYMQHRILAIANSLVPFRVCRLVAARTINISSTLSATGRNNIVPLSEHQSSSNIRSLTTGPVYKMATTAPAPSTKDKASNDIEAAKKAAAFEAVRNHFPSNPRFVGIGSGTTIVYVVQAIKELASSGKSASDGNAYDISRTGFVPTGYQSKQLIINAGLVPIEFDALPDDAMLDIAFDGADEVDEDLNCIKGGGACLYQEKLVAMRAKEFICVADHRKLQERLLSKWPTIPIEVEPKAARQVMHRLRVLGSRSSSGAGPFIREGHLTKAGPIKTDQDFFIIDAPFPHPLLISADLSDNRQGRGENGEWEVETLAKAIKEINGVLGVGLFCGPTGPEAKAAAVLGGQRPIACYFGMEDGSVSIRQAKEKDSSIVATYPPLSPVLPQ